MRDAILERLAAIEAAEGVRVLYACESGSRAWGFPSADSDYDVRFLYLRPTEWYLSIDERRDVLEFPISDALDINGWDLRKALRLARRSNPPLLEWLGSPIVYRQEAAWADELRELVRTYYQPVNCFHHYAHMARGNYRDALRGDEVWVKKYFYVLRPLLAMRWIERGLGVVPTEFGTLVDRILGSDPPRAEIDALLAQKRAGAELQYGPRIAAISSFIEGELDHWTRHPTVEAANPQSSAALDQFFRRCLAAW